MIFPTMKPLIRSSLFCAFILGITLAARAQDTATIISRARAYVGSDATLAAVKAIHYTGTLSSPGPDKTVVKAKIDVIFQSPYRMRQTVSTDTKIETTGLDDYGAWTLIQDPKDPTKRALGMLGPDPVRHMRANVWENLAFFRGIEEVGGHLEDAGTAALDGRSTRKLIFWHDSKVKFVRWFDPTTGELIQTETDDGSIIREAGEMVVAGVRFPKRITTTLKATDGSSSTATIEFDKIVVNDLAPESAFSTPLRSSAAAKAMTATPAPQSKP